MGTKSLMFGSRCDYHSVADGYLKQCELLFVGKLVKLT